MKLLISPTGNTYKSEWEAMNARQYEYEIAQENCITKQIKIIQFKDLKPNEGWLKSNEPEDHLDEIGKRLTVEIVPKNILCFSYKDQSLANRIFELNQCEIETIYDITEGIISQYPEDRDHICEDIANVLEGRKYDLIIMRHYLEHFPDCEKIICMLESKLSASGMIYLEVPDCGEFIKRNIPLYLWEQHRYYFTKDSLRRILINTDMRFSSIVSYGDSIEPSLCTTIRKKEGKNSGYNTKLAVNKSIKHHIDIDTYKNRWNELIMKNINKEIIVFGAGHNADRFIQMTGTSCYINKILDDNPSKLGKYLAGVNTKIEGTSYLRNKKDVLILLACHDRSVIGCTKYIRTLNSKASIYSIFQIPN